MILSLGFFKLENFYLLTASFSRLFRVKMPQACLGLQGISKFSLIADDQLWSQYLFFISNCCKSPNVPNQANGPETSQKLESHPRSVACPILKGLDPKLFHTPNLTFQKLKHVRLSPKPFSHPADRASRSASMFSLSILMCSQIC